MTQEREPTLEQQREIDEANAEHEMQLRGVTEELFKTAHDVCEALVDAKAYFMREVFSQRPPKYLTWSDDAQFMMQCLVEMLAEEEGMMCEEVK